MMGYVRMMKAADMDEVPPLVIDSKSDDFNYDDMPSLCSHSDSDSDSDSNSEFEEDPIPNLYVYPDHSYAPRSNRANTKGFAFILREGRYPLENHQSVEAAVEIEMQLLKALHRETLQQHAAFRQSSDFSSEMVELQERHRKALRQNEAFRELSEDSPVYSRQVYSVDSDQNMDEEFSDSENNGTSQVIEDPASYWFMHG